MFHELSISNNVTNTYLRLSNYNILIWVGGRILHLILLSVLVDVIADGFILQQHTLVAFLDLGLVFGNKSNLYDLIEKLGQTHCCLGTAFHNTIDTEFLTQFLGISKVDKCHVLLVGRT